MKKIFSLFAAVLMAGSMMAATSVYEHTFSTTDKSFTADGAATLSDVSWTLATTWVGDNKDYNKDASAGMKLGSNNKPIQTMTLTTSGISGVIDSIYFETNARSGAAVAMSVTVGGTAYAGPASFNGTGVFDTRSKLTYTGNKSGDIVLSWDETDANASKKGAFYLTVLKVYSHTEAPAEGWDGTVTLSKTTFTSLADLEGITLTFNGATTLALLDAEGSMIALQNEDGGEMYALWAPAYGGTYTINGTVVTLNGWYAAEGETDALPAESATLYVEDYGSFIVDGDEEATFETAEIEYATAGPTTYTVTYTVNGFDAEHCLVYACYYNVGSDNVSFEPGANTVPENMIAYISTTVIDGYTVEVKVNGAVVTLTNGNWEDDITADMTIEVTFAAPQSSVDYNFEITSAQIVSGKVGTIALNNNNYGSQAVATESTWYTFAKDGVEFKGAKVCVATDANGGGIQVQGNASDETKMGFIFNNTAMPEITAIAIEFRVVSTSTYDPSFHLYVGDAAHPTATAVEGSFTKTLVGGFNKYVYTFAVEGAPSYFTIANDLAGALYIDAIKVAYTPVVTAIDNVENVKIEKTIENGQLIIIRDGVRYNAAGHIVK